MIKPDSSDSDYILHKAKFCRALVSGNRGQELYAGLFSAVFLPAVLEIIDMFFLFCVYGDNRVACFDILRRGWVDVFKLGVPVRVCFTDLQHLLICLLAIPH
jgi:hypothetical protein